MWKNKIYEWINEDLPVEELYEWKNEWLTTCGRIVRMNEWLPMKESYEWKNDYLWKNE